MGEFIRCMIYVDPSRPDLALETARKAAESICSKYGANKKEESVKQWPEIDKMMAFYLSEGLKLKLIGQGQGDYNVSHYHILSNEIERYCTVVFNGDKIRRVSNANGYVFSPSISECACLCLITNTELPSFIKKGVEVVNA